MTNLRALAAALAAAMVIGLGQPAIASTYSTDITDMWFNPAEAGWGINVVLQNNVAFVTFFVYDVNRNPVWYTAQLTGQGGLSWTGGLYATTGPWFGGPFPTSGVTIRQAGTANFTLQFLDQAAFTYSIDGVTVIKTLSRQTWTNENYTGTYAWGFSIRATGCNPPSLNGLHEAVGFLNVNQSGTAIGMVASSNLDTCNFSGAYSQTGKLGSAQGTYSCYSGEQGTFLAYEMTPTVSGFTARIQGNNQYCQWSGYLGGLARAQ
jgi:hypothetical protein